jgi:nucleoside-diphosphate-sugar epimerase
VFADDANGAHGNAPTYDDTNIAQLKAIPDDAPHRPMELAALAADEAGYVRTYIVMPPVVYGIASGPLFDVKIANRHSILLPIVINSAIERKQAGMFGAGRNVWPLVHVNDMADLYVLVFNSILSASEPQQAPGHGWEGFYFAENGSFVFRDLSLAIGQALEKMGKVTDANPSAYTQEDLDKFYAGVSLSCLFDGNVSSHASTGCDLWQ